jgi:hypothetical protein
VSRRRHAPVRKNQLLAVGLTLLAAARQARSRFKGSIKEAEMELTHLGTRMAWRARLFAVPLLAVLAQAAAASHGAYTNCGADDMIGDTAISCGPESDGPNTLSRASADLATGKLKTYAEAQNVDGANAEAIAIAKFHDTVTFGGPLPPFASASAPRILFDLKVDGRINGSDNGFELAYLRLFNSQDHGSSIQIENGRGTPFVIAASENTSWNMGSYDGAGGVDVTFDLLGGFVPTLADPSVTFEVLLLADSVSSGFFFNPTSADFWNTARLNLDVPAGYSYSSDSGVLLTATAVPEPQTYVLLCAGLGLLGWMGWRRKQNTA